MVADRFCTIGARVPTEDDDDDLPYVRRMRRVYHSFGEVGVMGFELKGTLRVCR